mmetsp:Transcript_104734/g.296289  ORF Transcript_104734/g.296289 Transcript_104734/m.296289 type:complete len:251 (+) Transcript_104734:987-1739(+)
MPLDMAMLAAFQSCVDTRLWSALIPASSSTERTCLNCRSRCFRTSFLNSRRDRRPEPSMSTWLTSCWRTSYGDSCPSHCSALPASSVLISPFASDEARYWPKTASISSHSTLVNPSRARKTSKNSHTSLRVGAEFASSSAACTASFEGPLDRTGDVGVGKARISRTDFRLEEATFRPPSPPPTLSNENADVVASEARLMPSPSMTVAGPLANLVDRPPAGDAWGTSVVGRRLIFLFASPGRRIPASSATS